MKMTMAAVIFRRQPGAPGHGWAVILAGLVHEIREFVANPCKSCLWRDYQVKNRCAAKCHVRRKHEWFKKVRRGALSLIGLGAKA